jgi:hypothetical protein
MATLIPGNTPGFEGCPQLVLIHDGVWVLQDFPAEILDDAPVLESFGKIWLPQLKAKLDEMKAQRDSEVHQPPSP